MSRTDVKGPKWDISLIPDLTGKVVLVTGANSSTGIGYGVAHELALKGAKVYLGARSLAKAEGAVAEMKKASPSIPAGNLQPFVADLGDLYQVKKSAEQFVATESRLDILVNNAALVPRPLDFDSKGVSLSFATNHLGPFVLTVTLLPLLRKTAAAHPGVRIVTLTSETHAVVPKGSAKFDSVEAWNQEFGGTDGMGPNYVRYGYSKLANLLFARELQKKIDEHNVAAISVAVHPGGVKTSGAINFVGDQIDLLAGALEPEEGSITPLFAAAAPEVWEQKDKYKGSFLWPFGVVSPADESEDSKDPKLAEELWVTSKKVLKETYGIEV